MEEKRVTAMSFEEEEDKFSDNTEKATVDKNLQKPNTAQTTSAANNPGTTQERNPAKSPVQPINQQISKYATASPSGTLSKSSSNNTVSNSTKNKTEDQKQKKARKPRKTKDQIINDIEKQEEKFLKKLAILGEKKKKLTLTPEEKREEKRKAQTRCKIIAGAVAFDLYAKGEKFFTLENFKNGVESQVDKPLEIAFIGKIFKPKK